MNPAAPASASTEARARDWLRDTQEAVCDSIEPWEHGTVLRATRYPTYYNFNLVRVEGSADIDAQVLIAFTDGALTGLDHRRIDFETVELANALRPELLALGWRTTRLLWMHHERPRPRSSRPRGRGRGGALRGGRRAAHRLWHDGGLPEARVESSSKSPRARSP